MARYGGLSLRDVLGFYLKRIRRGYRCEGSPQFVLRTPHIRSTIHAEIREGFNRLAAYANLLSTVRMIKAVILAEVWG
jgi:hypothetical protein